MSSKIRMALAGLTVVALVGGVMAAGPAEAGKRKKKRHHHSSVVQVSKGGNARGGNAGHGGEGGDSGNVANTGNIGGPGVATVVAGPGAGVTPAQAACLTAALGAPPVGGGLLFAEIDACFPPGAVPAALFSCLFAAGAPGLPAILDVTAAELGVCLAPTTTVIVPGGGGGVVRSGRGGDGGAGGTGGAATGGAGAANTNTSTSTSASDDHSIEVSD
jgi:hypothetical protein